MPNQLYTLHRVLISVAIAFSLLLLIYGFLQYSRLGDVTSLGMGIAGAVIAVALAFYLRWFLRKRGV
jgi:hypothetical protein